MLARLLILLRLRNPAPEPVFCWRGVPVAFLEPGKGAGFELSRGEAP